MKIWMRIYNKQVVVSSLNLHFVYCDLCIYEYELQHLGPFFEWEFEDKFKLNCS